MGLDELPAAVSPSAGPGRSAGTLSDAVAALTGLNEMGLDELPAAVSPSAGPGRSAGTLSDAVAALTGL
ncbi:hypothetical protein G7L32_26970, partial [Klebsiella quasipneumoniae]|nr:hypothetical protein [Klebsiella quasipneumoniae]